MLPPVFLLEVLKVRPWLMILQKKGTMGESHLLLQGTEPTRDREHCTADALLRRYEANIVRFS